MIVEMQHGAQLGKRSSNPIQKVVNPVGTVITVSFPSEEQDAAQASDFSVTVPSECESAAEEEGGVKPPFHGHNRKDTPSVDDAVRWPAVSQPLYFSQAKGYESSKCKNTETETRTQRKVKQSTQSVSAEKYNKTLQDEGPKDESKDDHNLTVGETEHKEMMVPWKTCALENGSFAVAASVWEKGCMKKGADGIESKCKPQKSLWSKTSHTGIEDVSVKDEAVGRNNKETEVKMVKSKAQILLKIRDGDGASCKAKTVVTDEQHVQGNFKKGKSSIPEEDAFCEAILKLDEVRLSETRNSKQNTKTTSIKSAPDESIKMSVRDKHHTCLEGERKDGRTSVSKLMLMDNVSTSDSLDTEDNKDTALSLDEFDSLCHSGSHDIIKNTSVKSKVSKCLLLEDNVLVTVSDSGDNRNAADKLGSSVSVSKSESLKSYSSLLHEKFNEHHFGTGRNASHETVRNSDSESLPQKSEKGTWGSQFTHSVAEEKTRTQMREIAENKFCRGNSELEIGCDRGSQENLIFKPTFDDVFVPAQRSWSSIVSSSSRNRFPVRETMAPASSKTVSLKLGELRISPHQSWSDTTKGYPDQMQIEAISDTNICSGFHSGKRPEAVDDYSDESEDKVAADSRKSQSSDQTFCSRMVTASESVSTVATSESSGATAINEEECSLVNEENNGNDDELADSGGATCSPASQGANKKSRRTKKKKLKITSILNL